MAEGVDATRSRTADVPGFGVIRLAKFASMGSALCFPLEAMVFLTIIVTAIARAGSRPVTRSLLRELRGKVRVYGDDIIVPVEYVRTVTEHLEAFGLKVNSDKSYGSGKFRESCGGDYYDGEDVTPVRLRRVLPTTRKNTEELVSAISTRNQLYLRGYWRSAAFLDEVIRDLVPFPIVEATSPVHGRISCLRYEDVSYDPYLQRPVVRGVTVYARPPVNPAVDHAALLKTLLSLEHRALSDTTVPDGPSLLQVTMKDAEDLLRSGRPLSVDTKIRWAPVA
jgi:hypothetical protein